MEFGWIDGIPAGHAKVTQDKLRKEREVESNKDNDCRNPCPPVRIQAAGHFGPPVVNPAQITHDGAADHDVMEMSDDKVSIVNVLIQANAGQIQARQPADSEESDEAERIQHGSF